MDVLLNEMQRNLSEEYVKKIAYADNLACRIKGNSRVMLETYASRIIEILNKWCNLHKLKISTSKTVAMVVKEV